MGKTRNRRIGQRFDGDATVCEGSPDELFSKGIHDTVFLGDTLSFDWHLTDETIETVHLTTMEGIKFSGTSVKQTGTKRVPAAKVEAVLYSNSKGRVLLAHAIYYDGAEESWIIRLYEKQSK